MSSISGTSSGKKQRLLRGIALMFLIYTAMDLASPDLCRGEAIGDNPQGIVAEVRPRLIDNARQSVDRMEASDKEPTNEPAEQPSDDDDCFCCCSHVLPGTVIANVSVTDLRLPVTFLEYLSVLSPPLART